MSSFITSCENCETQVEINFRGHATHIDIEQDDHEPELSF